LKDIFSDVGEVELMGEIVEFKQFDFQGDTATLGIIKKKGKWPRFPLSL
jgi:hypothetical protein